MVTWCTHTLAVHDVTEEELESLDLLQLSKYRSQVARCPFRSQSRADLTFIVTELRQRMSNTTQQSLAKLRRLVGVKGIGDRPSVKEEWEKKRRRFQTQLGPPAKTHGNHQGNQTSGASRPLRGEP